MYNQLNNQYNQHVSSDLLQWHYLDMHVSWTKMSGHSKEPLKLPFEVSERIVHEFIRSLHYSAIGWRPHNNKKMSFIQFTDEVSYNYFRTRKFFYNVDQRYTALCFTPRNRTGEATQPVAVPPPRAPPVAVAPRGDPLAAVAHHVQPVAV